MHNRQLPRTPCPFCDEPLVDWPARRAIDQCLHCKRPLVRFPMLQFHKPAGALMWRLRTIPVYRLFPLFDTLLAAVSVAMVLLTILVAAISGSHHAVLYMIALALIFYGAFDLTHAWLSITSKTDRSFGRLTEGTIAMRRGIYRLFTAIITLGVGLIGLALG